MESKGERLGWPVAEPGQNLNGKPQKRNMKKTGIELIAQERQEQIEKHGYTQDHDTQYTENELVDFATALLQNNIGYYPWNPTLWVHVKRKTRLDQLAIAGALIAAEIDRLNSLEG